ncbi:hypothetical protein B0H14DRAFT_2609652 [Mycena olivaceomarginata]|nr:hypothetical protein B0H14DRAFT_2609652 [Mycena olivaceomarginata]
MADESPALSASQTGSQKRPWVISDSPTRSSDSRPTRPVLESHRSSVQNILLFSSDQPAAPKLGSQALPINVEDTSPRPKKKLKAKDLDAVQNRIRELEATTFPTPGPSRATSSHAAGSSRGAFVTLHANPAGPATLLITDEPLRSKINIRPRPGRGCADWPQQRSADRRQAYLVDPCRPLSTYSLLPPASAWPAVWFFDPFQRFELRICDPPTF